MSVKVDHDVAQYQRGLQRWFSSNESDSDVEVSEVSCPTAGGYSNETLLFDVTSSPAAGERTTRSLVARLQTEGITLFPDVPLRLQYDVMKSIGDHTDIPVPKVGAWVEDSSILGAPFFLMDRVEGRQPPSDDPPFTIEGWVCDLDDAGRRTLHVNTLSTMAQIHAVDYRAIGLGALEPAGDPLERDIDDLVSYYRRGCGPGPHPTIDAGFDWIFHNRPGSPADQVLNWGDSRMGNVIYGEDLSIAAVLDWEMASVASPLQELGYWLFHLRYYADAIGREPLSGFLTRDETLETYSKLSGFDVSDADFYETFSVLRAAVYVARIAHLLTEAGTLPTGSPLARNNPAVRILADRIGAPAPDELEASSYVSRFGNGSS
jgi:aminoglycoside phosphotransferase (APT) family kinase protein